MTEITVTMPEYTGGDIVRPDNPADFNTSINYLFGYHPDFATVINQWTPQANQLGIEINDAKDIVVAKEALINPHYTNIDLVGNNIDNVNLVALNVVPKVDEILQSEQNAIVATQQANIATTKAQESSQSATASETSYQATIQAIADTDLSGTNGYTIEATNDLFSRQRNLVLSGIKLI